MTRAVADQSAWPIADGLINGLKRYHRGHAYSDFPRMSLSAGHIYYDDNSWIALCLLQRALLAEQLGKNAPSQGDPERDLVAARKILRLQLRGEDRNDGGVRWRERGGTRNACSTGPAGMVAARVVEVEQRLGISSSDHDAFVAFAQRCADFIRRLRTDDGMVADHMRPDGSVEPSIYAYNQGSAIGLNLALFRITGDSSQLDRAKAWGNAGVRYYEQDPDRLWHNSPAFVAIFARHLMALYAELGASQPPRLVTDWLTRVQSEAFDPETERFIANGIGRYDGSIWLDHAGILQVRFLLHWPTELLWAAC